MGADSNARRATTTQQFRELRAFHTVLETIIIEDVPDGTHRVRALLASGESLEAGHDGQWTLSTLVAGTYAVQAIDESGRLLGEMITTVGRHPGERPVHGFATSFTNDDTPSVLAWHRALRSTVVQVYDWMASYTEPLGPATGWKDPSNRPVSLDALRGLANGLHDQGSVAHAYVPIYAVGHAFANQHPEMLMYEDNGVAIRFMDQIVLANPANEAWQRHFVESYGAAAEAIGFDGFHVDTYGYPRVAFDADGKADRDALGVRIVPAVRANCVDRHTDQFQSSQRCPFRCTPRARTTISLLRDMAAE